MPVEAALSAHARPRQRCDKLHLKTRVVGVGVGVNCGLGTHRHEHSHRSHQKRYGKALAMRGRTPYARPPAGWHPRGPLVTLVSYLAVPHPIHAASGCPAQPAIEESQLFIKSVLLLRSLSC
eukprot:365021-Chlamydomonas_euryale.AAC.10